MNKADLVSYAADKTSFPKKDVEAVISAALDGVTEALAGGEKVQLVGFGAFDVRVRAAREGRNPQTGEAVDIPETKVPSFKPGKALKDAVAGV